VAEGALLQFKRNVSRRKREKGTRKGKEEGIYGFPEDPRKNVVAICSQ